mmetsp:Transcript_7291/g.19106  ORF Transcript_7291/g.19106 Transcript_7291/m.19106 type:complete len:204 (-) Transcript_7291:150-761(-)
MALRKSLVVDLDSIIGRASSRHGGRRDDARVSERAEIHAELGVVVLAQELQMNLGHTIHCRRTHHRRVWRVVTRCGGTEDSNGRRREDAQIVLARSLEHVGYALIVYMQGELRILLAGRREKCRQMDNGAHLVLMNKGLEGLKVGDVELFEWPRCYELLVARRVRIEALRCLTNIGCDDIIPPVDTAKVWQQLGAHLPASARK